MEYCGGGSCADLLDILEEGCDEASIRYIIYETLKVRSQTMLNPCFGRRKKSSLSLFAAKVPFPSSNCLLSKIPRYLSIKNKAYKISTSEIICICSCVEPTFFFRFFGSLIFLLSDLPTLTLLDSILPMCSLLLLLSLHMLSIAIIRVWNISTLKRSSTETLKEETFSSTNLDK
jgi:hypothetical protein